MHRPDTAALLLLFAAWFAPVAPALADEASERGLAIAIEADTRDQGFGDTASTLQMTLRNRHGDETTRQMRSRALEVADDGDKSLIIFNDPADVKGTAFLSFSHKTGDDDQWLYLPALKRVKRISSSNKSGPFMGSEFAYEDLSSQEVDKYTYRYLRDEDFDDRSHYVIERVPVDKKSGYTRQTVWIDHEEYRVWKVEFYDRKDALLKTLVFDQYQRYLDKHWRASLLDMTNHQTGKSTRLDVTDYVFGNGFSDSDFNRNSLAKAR
ncbi:MAG: outer membrane lipoprotein-sorting protein [Gammaproteobacteria bacterium]|nr:outer membrane lipoprotein-sorting protein [Gammaproteobacteria bacterium]MDH3768497.1 outer membrane lipoprotein-sorting protein [Gammaproteobacteria bacterium]